MKRLPGALSLAAVALAYLLLRGPLFALHGMKQFPLLLFAAAGALIALTGLLRGQRVLPVLLALGYILGFAAGALFGYDYAPGYNNLWIIWLWCQAASGLIGLAAELALKRKAPKK